MGLRGMQWSRMGWDMMRWHRMGCRWGDMGHEMGWDGTPWHSSTPTHCDVGIMELQAIECPAAGGHKGGDGQGKGQAPCRLAPDNLGLQEQRSGRERSGWQAPDLPSPTHQVSQWREVHADGEDAAEKPQVCQACPCVNQDGEVAVASDHHSQEQQDLQQHWALGGTAGGRQGEGPPSSQSPQAPGPPWRGCSRDTRGCRGSAELPRWR